MYFLEYAAWLKKGYAAFVIDPSWIEIGPFHKPTCYPVSPPWSTDWAILFPDGYYAYLYERWYPDGMLVRGCPRPGRREHFSFHYGPTNPKLKTNGIPEPDKNNYPALIRIDCDRWGPHVHFHGEAHIEQARVTGMNIRDVDPFVFMQAVFQHRAAGTDFDSILQFKVTP